MEQLGHTEVACHVVDCDALLAEHDENELRKPFKPSERIAIAEALMARLRGRNHRPNNSGQAPVLLDAGQSRDLAAKKAGFGSGRTLERARQVLKKGTSEIVEAMHKAGAAIVKRPTAPTNPSPLP
jgi:ParB family chromosome partitioning protein